MNVGTIAEMCRLGLLFCLLLRWWKWLLGAYTIKNGFIVAMLLNFQV